MSCVSLDFHSFPRLIHVIVVISLQWWWSFLIFTLRFQVSAPIFYFLVQWSSLSFFFWSKWSSLSAPNVVCEACAIVKSKHGPIFQLDSKAVQTWVLGLTKLLPAPNEWLLTPTLNPHWFFYKLKDKNTTSLQKLLCQKNAGW